jgi:predicted RNA binding protein YcfA (HicA-like mRNA interferase family)
MSVKRQDIIKHFENNGFYLLREGGNHSIYSNGVTVRSLISVIEKELIP